MSWVHESGIEVGAPFRCKQPDRSGEADGRLTGRIGARLQTQYRNLKHAVSLRIHSFDTVAKE
jgi:hypothetical protein